MLDPTCGHLDTIAQVAAPATVCETCIEIGSTWFHLRQCMQCGRTGCCDDSPNRHASGHVRESGHPIVRSAEPGEEWAYCYPDDAYFERLPA
jgi:CPA2 family monovalent cation:H+ antiporter-2